MLCLLPGVELDLTVNRALFEVEHKLVLKLGDSHNNVVHDSLHIIKITAIATAAKAIIGMYSIMYKSLCKPLLSQEVSGPMCHVFR
jgi:hypothetical protein